MLCVIHREIAVAARLLLSLLKAPQVRVETAIARERLRQIEADFPVLSIQSGGVLNALRMSMLINAQNPLRLPVPFLAFVAMLTTAWMSSTVDLPFLKPL